MNSLFVRSVALALAGLPISAMATAQTCNTADRSVLLILDASGSMNALLPNGESRMEVARRAVKGVASFIPVEAQLSLRFYGAQSPRAEENCKDTNVAVPFGPASESSTAIEAAVDGVTAQGYTPIGGLARRISGTDSLPPTARSRLPPTMTRLRDFEAAAPPPCRTRWTARSDICGSCRRLSR